MALTRKALVAMGIEAEKIDQIIEMHVEVTEALKNEVAAAKDDAKKYKANSDKLESVEKELKELKDNKDGEAYKEKYDKLKAEYENYKGEQTKKETKDAKEKVYRKLLKEVGISDKRLDAVVRISDIDSIELDENGAIKNIDKLKESVKKDFDDYIVTSGEKGAETVTPPKSGGVKMSKEDIMKIENDAERQRAIAENHELFGF